MLQGRGREGGELEVGEEEEGVTIANILKCLPCARLWNKYFIRSFLINFSHFPCEIPVLYFY